MKKMMMVLMVLMLVSGAAMAQDTEDSSSSRKLPIGLRAGLTLSPDQFHFGAHTDLGPVVQGLRLVPNVEIGLGDNLTVIAINGDLLYDFPDTPFSAGGELGFIHTNFDLDIPGVDTSDTNLGMSLLGNYRLEMSNGKTVLLEAKLGLIDSPDFKATVGYYFF